MLEISQLKLPAGSDPAGLEHKIRRILRLEAGAPLRWEISRHSVDARQRPLIYDVYTVLADAGREAERRCAGRAAKNRVRVVEKKKYAFPAIGRERAEAAPPPVVVGFGPAGIFCALELAEHGFRPVVLERGAPAEERVEAVRRFWSTGRLDPSSNVQFGEGGAGTFSDGKLTTGVRDPEGRGARVREQFVGAGAPPEILYEQYPHIGTDRLREVVISLREKLIRLGGEIRFHARVTDLVLSEGRIRGVEVLDENTGQKSVLPAEAVVLAPGHSARDTVRMLLGHGVPMAQKQFAVGLRVSHPQSLIDRRQYGDRDEEERGERALPHASYKLTARASSGRGVYSFCMCPGGYVVDASSERGRLAVNGMSDYARDSGRANSAVVVTVGPEEFGSDEILAGMRFQEKLEEKAFRLADGKIPVEDYRTFERLFREGDAGGETPVLQGRELTEEEKEALCLRGRAAIAPVHDLMERSMTRDFIEGMNLFEKSYPGFTGEDAWVCGIESRTSSPVRILRDEEGQSEIRGLFPCGEGAGYAGGIMSAAMDGLRIAEAVARLYLPRQESGT